MLVTTILASTKATNFSSFGANTSLAIISSIALFIALSCKLSFGLSIDKDTLKYFKKKFYESNKKEAY